MKILLLLIMFALGGGGNTPAEPADDKAVVLQGIVLEKGTSEPLPGATVYLEDTKIKVYTDFEGNFSLDNLQPGRYTVKVSYPSFDEKTLQNVEIRAGANNLLISL
jgi:hypothetical protein